MSVKNGYDNGSTFENVTLKSSAVLNTRTEASKCDAPAHVEFGFTELHTLWPKEPSAEAETG